ncbi:MAG: DUF1993 domain-containing protein [Alphaproteobacteria bacterium]|nr:DUF1993 domain-containing protein [Alphaproteobacteria bacterium]MBL6936251.1 DUF1993 domain-containing protein [Alphaproteobacteria bacterium]MBL7098698.1 DUF1993 domain-containing protein [Alphaproteobacteria bacterium]
MISMHAMAVEGMVPMLASLSECLDKGEAHARANKLDLVNARLAPDMYTLAQQVQQACHYVNDGLSRLAAAGPAQMPGVQTTFAGLKAQIADTIAKARAVSVSALKGAEDRDCSIEIPGNLVIALTGLTFLRAWTLPHFYFHVVTAYDILRHNGVQIGKRDYLSQIGGMIRPK